MNSNELKSGFTQEQLRKAVKGIIAKLWDADASGDKEKLIASTLVENGVPASVWPLVDYALHWVNDLDAWADGEMDVFDPIAGADGTQSDKVLGHECDGPDCPVCEYERGE